jgi:hypothetical protein
MLGATPESSEAFSTCSEAAADEKAKGKGKAEKKKEDRLVAAKASIITAAKNKIINDTSKKMEDLSGCLLRASRDTEDAKCWASATQF